MRKALFDLNYSADLFEEHLIQTTFSVFEFIMASNKWW